VTLLALAAALLAAPSPACPWLERAYAAPPEIAAALLMRCPEPDRKKRAEQLDEAFQLAARASQSYQEFGAATSDSLAGKRTEASMLRMDGLSLRVQAVRAMMAVNPRRALAMALEMPVPAPPPARCEDATVARLDEYYGMVLQMARSGFTAKEREDGRHMEFLLRVINASTTPEQLQGATALVRQYGGDEADQMDLTAALAGVLSRAAASPRAFALTPALEAEMEVLRRKAGGTVLDEAYEAYVKTQRAAKACAAADTTIFWETTDSREIQRELGRLRPAPAKPTAEWEARFTALLHRIEAWQEDKEAPPMAHFHMKAWAYTNLLDQTGSAPLLEPVLSSFVRFLKDAPAKTEYPAEWMAYVRRLQLPWAPAGPLSVEIARGEIRRSGDAVMNLVVDAGGM
jgi:hypothetical protein